MVLMSKTEKKYSAEIFFFSFFSTKIAIYLSLGLHKGRPGYKRSLQPLKGTPLNPDLIWIHNIDFDSVHYLSSLPNSIGQIRGIFASSMTAKIVNFWDRDPPFVCLSRAIPTKAQIIRNRIKIKV
jgi:hypothetical protein